MTALEIAGKLTEAQRAALAELPLPRDADPVRWIAARPYGSTWRKASKHREAFLDLEAEGLVERKRCRGETLWRLTKPLGLSVRSLLKDNSDANG